MAVFKCKMCGGALEVNNETVVTCSYCGTQQTLPKLDDEKRAQLYDRANYFRRENEFDKAMGIYEMILSDEKTDSEAYWGIVLCRYGIEYVEDPRTHKRIPTVNRAQFTSIFDDEDYKKALEYSDSLQKGIYEAEAGVIDKIQKGILAVSSKEDPFDIFICYKETDNFGNRTQDSVYAQDIYNALTKEGYKVFFSRITLEEKLGSAYEPYIFAALNSAKVMLVVGTNKDNFNAVWVKNEWSRFISLIKAGKEKTLIPLYKDMSPYEMPEEFQYLQSQDMGKIGYLQDVIHGIKKLVEANVTTVKETVVVNAGNTQIEPLLKRAFIFLEDGEFARADEFCEQVLNIDPECAEAYLGKLMVELRVNKREALKDCEKPFDDKNNYQKILCYGDPILKTELKGYTEHINVRKKSEYIASIYESAETAMMLASYEKAISLFESISDYKDSATLANEARKRLVAQKKHNKKIGIIAVACVVSLIVSLVLGINIDNNVKYNNAIELMEEGKYQEALQIFWSLNGIRDCDKYVSEILSEIAVHETISAGYNHTVGLESDGTVIAVGSTIHEKCDVDDWADIVAISASEYHTVGLISDGTVIATGHYEEGQCDVSYWTDIVAISAGKKHTVGLKSDGTVIAVGSNTFGECDLDNWIDVIAISAGYNYTVGLKSDGTVIAKGYNYYGQCDTEDWTDIVAISAGDYHIVGLKSDGTVVVTGDNEYCQCDVSKWTDIVAISAGDDHIVGLKFDGTVVATGDYEDGQCDVSNWTDIVAISAGGCHTVGLKSDGTVVAVGENDYGQCDVSDWTDIKLPENK